MLSSKVYSITNNKAGYTRQRGWDPLQERELILAHLNKYSKSPARTLWSYADAHQTTLPGFSDS